MSTGSFRCGLHGLVFKSSNGCPFKNMINSMAPHAHLRIPKLRRSAAVIFGPRAIRAFKIGEPNGGKFGSLAEERY